MTDTTTSFNDSETNTQTGIREKLFDNQTRIAATIVTFVTMMAGLGAATWLSDPFPSRLLYMIAYITGGFYGVSTTIESLKQGKLDIDMLMILAALGAAIVGAPFEGAMLLFLFSLSNVLQAYALDRTSHAIRALMDLRPDEAMIYERDQLVTKPVEEIKVGDRLVVRPGERIPLDGVIQEGETAVDQSPITGESIPVEKRVGDMVLAGTINQNGSIEVAVSHLAKDSTLARLINLVAEAQSQKAHTQRFIDRAEQYYAWGVILVTIVAIVFPILALSEPFVLSFYRGMTLLVAASPCALVISTPATVLSAVGNGARRGVLFKGGVHVENAASIKVFAFDKTGTLTIGEPRLADTKILDPRSFSGSENDLLCLAASAEQKSEHPLARAIVLAANERGISLQDVTEFQAIPGKGVEAIVEGRRVQIGNQKFFDLLPEEAGADLGKEALKAYNEAGMTGILIALDEVIVGAAALADQLRPGVAQVMESLKSHGVTRNVMLTGDHERIGRHIAELAGLDGYYADLMPEDKLEIIRRLEAEYGPVAMVGDGVNDAPALAAATLGIAMGAAGTDVAMETADVVLMGDDLSNIPYLFELSRKTRKTLVQNLVFALLVIVVLISATLGFELALPLGVIGHEGSTVLVSLNGIRLLGFRGVK